MNRSFVRSLISSITLPFLGWPITIRRFLRFIALVRRLVFDCTVASLPLLGGWSLFRTAPVCLRSA
jgi:hypothetical protein